MMFLLLIVMPAILIVSFIFYVFLSSHIQSKRIIEESRHREREKKECSDCGYESDSGIHMCKGSRQEF
ncbi:MAG: hypothetical protein FJZ43_02005 [Candidatus Staskawiczbacteria bacterium]|nr:hypothetical protein [Candidatus Staskawiczbacteria bacterium]